eukprot:22707-Chlamydomonas_euryale.AAC.24
MAPSPVEEHEAGAGAAWGPGGGRGGARPSLLLSGVGATAPPPELEAVVLARMRVASPVEIAKPVGDAVAAAAVLLSRGC